MRQLGKIQVHHKEPVLKSIVNRCHSAMANFAFVYAAFPVKASCQRIDTLIKELAVAVTRLNFQLVFTTKNGLNGASSTYPVPKRVDEFFLILPGLLFSTGLYVV